MNSLEQILAADWITRLGWTLLHSLWQIALVTGVLALLLSVLRRGSANVRYLTACGGLAVMAIAPVVTYQMLPDAEPSTVAALPITEAPTPAEIITADVAVVDVTVVETSVEPSRFPVFSHSGEPAKAASLPAATAASVAADANVETATDVKSQEWSTQRIAAAIGPWMPWCVVAWLVGVFAVSVWNLGGWIAAQRLKRLGTSPVAEDISRRLAVLADRSGIHRSVNALKSLLVEVPVVVGWLRPVILLPAGILTGLTPAELDSILAHELAHIRRHDYLVNLLQTVVETLLFYHPGVWWVSRQIRIEREHCCDDRAVAVCGNKIDYAAALAAVEASRGAPKMAMAARKPDGSTLGRIRRVLGLAGNGSRRWTSSLAGGLVTSALIVAIVTCFVVADEPAEEHVDWAKAAAEVFSDWKVSELGRCENADIGTAEASRLLLSKGRWEYIGTIAQQQRAQIGVRREVDYANDPDYRRIFSRVDIYTFDEKADLPKDVIKKLSWTEWEDTDGLFVKTVDLGTGLGRRWFVRTTLMWQDLLRTKLELTGGDDPIALLAEGLLVEDKGNCTANSVEHLLEPYGDKAVAHLKRRIDEPHTAEELARLVSPLAFIQTDAADDLINALYADPKTKDAAEYGLGRGKPRKACKAIYLDLLKQRKRISLAGEACVEFDWQESGPILHDIYTTARHRAERETSFMAWRNLRGRPVPEGLIQARYDISSYAGNPEQADVVEKSRTTILQSTDKEAARFIATSLAESRGYKIPGEKVEAIRRIGKELVEKLGDDAEETSVEDESIAWGKPVDGLQAGLATAFEHPRPYKIGTNVPLRFLLRNTTDKSITLTHPRVPVFIKWENYRRPPGPQLLNPDGEEVFPASGVGGRGLPGNVERTIAPGEVITMTTTRLPLRPEGWKGTSVNLLTYFVEEGKHQVSLSYGFDDQGGKQWGGTVITGKLDLFVHDGNQPLALPGIAWGRYTDGVRCRVNADKTRLEPGEPPILLVDLQNHHTRREIRQIWHGLEFKLEIDGKWTGKLAPMGVNGPIAHLGPGDEWINVPLVLQDDRYYMAATPSMPGGQVEFSDLLGPGLHTIRVDIDGVISNPIEIEITPDQPAPANGESTVLDADLLAKRDALLAEADAKIRAGLVKLAEKYPYLKKAKAWPSVSAKSAPGTIGLYIFHTNQGKAAHSTPVPEGEEFSILVILEEPRREEMQLSTRPIYRNLGLVGQIATKADNPTLEAELKRLVADARTPLAHLDSATEASPADDWGTPIDGVQCRIQPAKLSTPGQMSELRDFVRRTGKVDLLLSTVQTPNSRLIVDGQYYFHQGEDLTGVAYHLSSTWEKEPRGFPVTLDGGWRSFKDGTPLRLTPGKHTIRFGWPGYHPMLGFAEKRLRPDESKPVLLMSNKIEIEVADDSRFHEGGVTGTAWSKPVDGLRWRISLPSDQVEVGKRIAVDMEFENVSDKPIRIFKTPTVDYNLYPTLYTAVGNTDVYPIEHHVEWDVQPEQTVLIDPGKTYRTTWSKMSTKRAGPAKIRSSYYSPENTNPNVKHFWSGRLDRHECKFTVVLPDGSMPETPAVGTVEAPKTPEDMQRAWNQLGTKNQALAYEAVASLRAAGLTAVRLADKHIKLSDLGPGPFPQSVDQWRTARAIRMLELIGSDAAKALLTRITVDARGHWPEVFAQAALKRLADQPSGPTIDKFGVNRGMPIYDGFLFFDGKHMPAPYVVERWGVDVYINGILVQRGHDDILGIAVIDERKAYREDRLRRGVVIFDRTRGGEMSTGKQRGLAMIEAMLAGTHEPDEPPQNGPAAAMKEKMRKAMALPFTDGFESSPQLIQRLRQHGRTVPEADDRAKATSIEAAKAKAEAEATEWAAKAKAEAVRAQALAAERAAKADEEAEKAAKARALALDAAKAHMSPITRRWTEIPSYEELQKPPAVIRVLGGAARGEAHDAEGKAERLRDVYRSAHRPGPVTEEGRAAFEKAEQAYEDLLKLVVDTDLEANAVIRFAGLYKYVHEKDKPMELIERYARKRKAQKIKRDRMLAAIPRELNEMIERMMVRWTIKVSTDEIQAMVAELPGPKKQAVDLIVEHFGSTGNSAFRHRAIPALQAIGGPEATKTLLKFALRPGSSGYPRTFADKSTRSYLALVKERDDIYRLFASDDEGVLWHAMSTLRGQAVDDTLLQTAANLLQSESMSSRMIAIDVLADDPKPDHAERKLQLVLDSIATARRIENPDRPVYHGNMTGVEALYYHYISGLKRMQGIDETLKKVEAEATGMARTCVVLARAQRGDQTARDGVLKVLVDPEAGTLRALAAYALEDVGRVEDLAVLRKVAETDPLNYEDTHRVPGGDARVFPVRDAAKRTILAIEKRGKDTSD